MYTLSTAVNSIDSESLRGFIPYIRHVLELENEYIADDAVSACKSGDLEELNLCLNEIGATVVLVQ